MTTSALLPLRAIVMVVLVPGTVAGYLPLYILRATGELTWPQPSLSAALAVALLITGVSVLLRSVWDFFAAGRGTLAPFDPPRHLVVRGLYRYTRNPMYNGVLAALLGHSWLFQSVAVLQYAAGVALMFHLVVVFYEEPALVTQFGESYRAYRAMVPRWGFTTRAYRA
jgi:protein-S-isoprenylcysteine O-methyltransferase Ste14